MPAELLHRERLDFDDGAVAEMVLWRVREPVPGCRYSYKYRMYYGMEGKRIIGYDNERGKGDHRHRQDHQEPYRFTTVERLIGDFLADVAKERVR
jgi:hypothetical protein